jgi:hypothetical protein
VVGDTLRAIYDQLSRDPNSLANLDQDLPNYAQHQVPIFSLPQEWLWCETWCSDKSKKKVSWSDEINPNPNITLTILFMNSLGEDHRSLQQSAAQRTQTGHGQAVSLYVFVCLSFSISVLSMVYNIYLVLVIVVSHSLCFFLLLIFFNLLFFSFLFSSFLSYSQNHQWKAVQRELGRVGRRDSFSGCLSISFSILFLKFFWWFSCSAGTVK